MTANDRLLHFMAQPLLVEKHGEFAVTPQFFIEVQLSSSATASNSLLAHLPSHQPKSLLFKP